MVGVGRDLCGSSSPTLLKTITKNRSALTPAISYTVADSNFKEENSKHTKKRTNKTIWRKQTYVEGGD